MLLCLVGFMAAPLVLVQGQEAGQPADFAGPSMGFVHEVWTTQDGLPVNSINALLQSRDGYIWAATFDGLVRFDGVRFTVYHEVSCRSRCDGDEDTVSMLPDAGR